MAQWEWLEDETYQRDLTEFVEAPTGGGYGDRVIIDNTRPRFTGALGAEGMDATDWAAVVANVHDQGALYTFALADGGSIIGVIETLQGQRIKGTKLRNVRATVRIVTRISP